MARAHSLGRKSFGWGKERPGRGTSGRSGFARCSTPRVRRALPGSWVTRRAADVGVALAPAEDTSRTTDAWYDAARSSPLCGVCHGRGEPSRRGGERDLEGVLMHSAGPKSEVWCQRQRRDATLRTLHFCPGDLGSQRNRNPTHSGKKTHLSRETRSNTVALAGSPRGTA